MLNSDDIGMVAITETFFDNTILDIELVDTNYYSVFRRDRNRHGGGVILIVKEGIPTVRRHDLETDCELLWVELSFTSTNVLVGVFYNPLNSNIDSITNLEHSLSFLHSSNPPVVTLCGDLPGITWNMINPTVSTNSGEATQMMDIVNELNLVQLVMEPTRGNNILDLVLTNKEDVINEVAVVNGLPGSDHSAIGFSFTLRTKRTRRDRREVYNFKRWNFVLFCKALKMVPWNRCLLNNTIDENWRNFKVVLFHIADQCIPKTSLKSKKGCTSCLTTPNKWSAKREGPTYTLSALVIQTTS